MGKQLYTELWSKYSRLIILKLFSKSNEDEKIQLSKAEFVAVGERVSSGYGFNLEFKNGKVDNNIDGSAVARDLVDVLLSNQKFREQAKDKSIKINLDSSFVLHLALKESKDK